jgi:hypothetical protein
MESMINEAAEQRPSLAEIKAKLTISEAYHGTNRAQVEKSIEACSEELEKDLGKGVWEAIKAQDLNNTLFSSKELGADSATKFAKFLVQYIPKRSVPVFEMLSARQKQLSDLMSAAQWLHLNRKKLR